VIEIEQIGCDIAEELCRKITKDLPEYFGIPDANEHYAQGMRSRLNLAAKLDDEYVGLISIDHPYPNNSNIYWMAVLKAFQGKGIGAKLIIAACHKAQKYGATSMTVDTLAPENSDENYLKTYKFYQANGFMPLLNLKPEGYEWDMVYMAKKITEASYKNNPNLSIRMLELSDITHIIKNFAKYNWPKSVTTFETYLQEQNSGDRLVWLAFINEQFAGYVTLNWQSKYISFKENKIPEIMDLNVLPPFRKHGVASNLLETAELLAATRADMVGIGVGLYGDVDSGYGAAQKLYVNRGYIPDGLGITYDYKRVVYDQKIPLDDDLVLWFIKQLR